MSYRSDLLAAQLRTAQTRAERRTAATEFMTAQASPEQVRASTRSDQEFRTFLRSSVDNMPVELRTAKNMNESVLAAGGNAVPTGFADSVLRDVKEFDSILADCEDLEVSNGQDWNRPGVSSFTASGAATAETGQLTDVTSTVISFDGQQMFGFAPTYGALLRWSMQLEQDANVNLSQLAAASAAESIGRQVASVASTALYANAATGQKITGGVSIAVVASMLGNLDPAYLRNACVYVSMADYATLVAEDPIKFAALPMPVVPTNAAKSFDDANTTAPTGPILADLGNWFTFRHVNSVTVVPLRERYADLAENAMVCYLRADFASTGRFGAAVYMVGSGGS